MHLPAPLLDVADDGEDEDENEDDDGDEEYVDVEDDNEEEVHVEEDDDEYVEDGKLSSTAAALSVTGEYHR